MIILLTGCLISQANGTQVITVTDHGSSHPELVSGTSGTTITASASSSIETSVGDQQPVEKGNFFTRNWGALMMGLLGFADLVTRLTPTEKDNSIVNFLVSVLNAVIPNLKKGGGRL